MNWDRLRCRLFGHKKFPMEPLFEEPSICVRCGEVGV